MKYHHGDAGSYILLCLECGAGHFRQRVDGQGTPSWCVNCCAFKRDGGVADGRVVAVLQRHQRLWQLKYAYHDQGRCDCEEHQRKATAQAPAVDK